MTKVLIVGAGLAGAETARQLREQGFEGSITLLGKEDHFPYDRPQLSKDILLSEEAPVYLEDRQSMDSMDVDLHMGEAAQSADLARRLVAGTSGNEYPFDILVVASGARARRLTGPLADALPLRTVEDALRLRRHLASCRSFAIVGGSFLGLEIASACRELGKRVIVVGRSASPLRRKLGESASLYCEQVAVTAGVELALGRSIVDATLEPTGRGRIYLDGGELVEADCVVVATGVEPNIEWLQGSGLNLRSGVVCDSHLRAARSVYAVGDVASWAPNGTGSRSRVEHRQNAVQQAATVAYNILHPDSPRAHEEPSYFWSNMFGSKMQVLGSLGLSEQIVGHVESGQFAVVYRDGSTFAGVFVANAPAVTAISLRGMRAGVSADSIIAQMQEKLAKNAPMTGQISGSSQMRV